MRGKAFLFVFACALALVPGLVSHSASATSAYAGARVSPHDSAHASAQASASAPDSGCSITGGRATFSTTYVRNPVPFGKADLAVHIGRAQVNVDGPCHVAIGTFNSSNCAPDGLTTCTSPYGAEIVTMFTTFPVDVTVTVSGIGSAGQLVQDTASCSMVYQAFYPQTSCDLS